MSLGFPRLGDTSGAPRATTLRANAADQTSDIPPPTGSVCYIRNAMIVPATPTISANRPALISSKIARVTPSARLPKS